MRFLTIAAVLFLTCPAVFAGEVVLEEQENKSGNPVAYVKTDRVKLER